MDHIQIRLSMQECSPFCNKFHQLYLWGPEKLNTFYVLRKTNAFNCSMNERVNWKLVPSGIWGLVSGNHNRGSNLFKTWYTSIRLPGITSEETPNLRHWQLYKFSNRTFIFLLHTHDQSMCQSKGRWPCTMYTEKDERNNIINLYLEGTFVQQKCNGKSCIILNHVRRHCFGLFWPFFDCTLECLPKIGQYF
jgi:hypothetical protein